MAELQEDFMRYSVGGNPKDFVQGQPDAFDKYVEERIEEIRAAFGSIKRLV